MSQYPRFAIVISFFCLWISTLFSSLNQVFIGFSIILTFGILHGANDLLIFKNLLINKTAISFSKMLFLYIFTVLIGGFLFFVAPSLILAFFIIVSGFHFGEQQLSYIDSEIKTKTLSVIKTSYGLVVLFLLFALHPKEVQTIIIEITTNFIFVYLIMYGFYTVLVFFATCYLYLYFKTNTSKTKLLLEIFYLIVFAVIFKVSSLIWGFAIYFVIWHSIPSLIDQIKFLYGDFTKINCIRYVKSALLYWFMSLIGLAVFYFVFKEMKLFNSMFFSFLAAITFPHVYLIEKMFSEK